MEKDVIGLYPNKTTRRLLAVEWESLKKEEQLILKANRSRRGIKCDICGLCGYFRENCPNKCTSPPGTPDSMDSTPPDSPRDTTENQLGLFWGNVHEEKKSKKKFLTRKADLSTLRADSIDSMLRMKEEDKDLVPISFFSKAKETYARDYAEMNLHQLLRRIMRLIETQLKQNIENLESTFDTTLLHPPADKVGDVFYPPEMFDVKEFRDYYVKKTLKVNRRQNHKNQSSVRNADDLDPILRGGSLDSDFLYQTKSDAGASIHSKNSWKALNGKHDSLANANPTLLRKQQKINELFHSQGQWITNQEKSMMFRNDRFEHMIHIIRGEIEKEHQRDYRLLDAKKRVLKSVRMDVYQERLSSVDLLTKVLKSYKFTSGTEEADFLLFCLDRWKKINQPTSSVKQQHKSIPDDDERSHTEGGDGDTDNISHDERTDEEQRKLEEQQRLEQEAAKKPKKPTKTAGQKDLVVAATANPYIHDVQYLKQVKRHNERVFQRSKAGAVFTAVQQRQKEKEDKRLAEEKKQKEEEDFRKSLFPMTASFVNNLTSSRFVGNNAESKGNVHTNFLDIVNAEQSRDEQLASVQEESIDDIMEAAKFHSTALETEEARLLKQKHIINSSLPVKQITVKRKLHPREKDQIHIYKMKQAFKRAGLGNRIRKGNDDDFANVLPALIPIPQAFDGNSQLSSYAGQNIVWKLKKEMVLSDLGYKPQTVVPLYVRNTLQEIEGTSMDGDPTQEELDADRRYSHFLGRPIVRFNPAQSQTKQTATELLEEGANNLLLTNKAREQLQEQIMTVEMRRKKKEKQPDISYNLSNKEFSLEILTRMSSTLPAISQATTIGDEKEQRQQEREKKRAAMKIREEAKYLPTTNSLVRLVFNNPEPTLADLQYLDEDF